MYRQCWCALILLLALSVPHNCEGQPKPISAFAPFDYIDSVHYGRPAGSYAIVINLDRVYLENEDIDELMTIHVLKKKGKRWVQTYVIDSLQAPAGLTAIGTVNPGRGDYNKDGLADLQLFMGSGANGGNGYSCLYVFDNSRGSLRYIRGSREIPNLSVSRRTGVIHGVAYYDGISYTNYKIKNDSLVETGGIDVWRDEYYNHHQHYIIAPDGKHKRTKMIKVKRSREELYTNPEEQDCFG